MITDSVGRAWRVGTVGLALGAAGVQTVADIRGQLDRQGRELKVSIVGIGDEIHHQLRQHAAVSLQHCPIFVQVDLEGDVVLQSAPQEYADFASHVIQVHGFKPHVCATGKRHHLTTQ